MGKILKNCLYITSGIVLSEIIYKTFKIFYKLLMDNYLKTSTLNLNNSMDLVLFSGNSSDCKCNSTTNIIVTNCSSIYCGLKNIQIFIKLIDLSKKSIYLCVYLITSTGIGNAIIRANKRGVKIFIITDNGAANNPTSQIQRLLKEDIPIKFQNSEETNIMHHKFCLIDVDWIDSDDNADDKPHVVKHRNSITNVGDNNVGDLSDDNVPVDNIFSECAISDNKNMSNYSTNHLNCDLRKSVFNMKKCAVNKINPLDSVFIPKGGLVLTGSLNWTTQAFFNNYENILITSNNYMINEYQKEFQRLWKSFIKEFN